MLLARTEMAKMIRDSGADAADQLSAFISQKGKNLLTIDPHFGVELALLSSLCGPGSEGRLQATMLDMMPDATREVEPSQVLTQLKQLTTKQTYRYAQRSAQAKVQAVTTWMGRIVDDRAPDLGLAHQDPMLLEVVAKFQFFVRLPNPEDARVTLFGWQALQEMHRITKAKLDRGQATMADCTPFVVWGYLIPHESKGDIDAMLKGITEAVGGMAVATKRAKKAGSKASSSTDGGPSSDDTAVAKAMAMFS